jgi:hypothetical protein
MNTDDLWIPYGLDDDSMIPHVVWRFREPRMIRCHVCSSSMLVRDGLDWWRVGQLTDEFAREHLHGRPMVLIDQ